MMLALHANQYSRLLYSITRIEGRDYIKQAIITWHGEQNPRTVEGWDYSKYYIIK